MVVAWLDPIALEVCGIVYRQFHGLVSGRTAIRAWPLIAAVEAAGKIRSNTAAAGTSSARQRDLPGAGNGIKEEHERFLPGGYSHV